MCKGERERKGKRRRESTSNTEQFCLAYKFVKTNQAKDKANKVPSEQFLNENREREKSKRARQRDREEGMKILKKI